MAAELQQELVKLRRAVLGMTTHLGLPKERSSETTDLLPTERKIFCIVLLLAALALLRAKGKTQVLYGEDAEGLSSSTIKSCLDKLYELTAAAVTPNISQALKYAVAEFDCASLLKAHEHWQRASINYAVFDDCMLGYVYQFLQEPIRRLSLKKTQSSNKSCSVTDIIAFTQIYTPPWVADYLIEKSIRAPRRASDLRILDPACGTGHFLNRALYFLQTADEQADKSAATAGFLQNNLVGCDIDPISLWVAGLSLIVQYLETCKVAPVDIPQLNLHVVAEHRDLDEPVLGTLSRSWPANHILCQRFDAVIGNPPYIGRKLIDRRLKEVLKSIYADSHQDLCTAFITRGLELLKPAGRLAFITQSSMLYLPTYTKFRAQLLNHHSIIDVVEAGTQVFPSQNGEKINSILLVVENTSPHPDHVVKYTDLRWSSNKKSDLRSDAKVDTTDAEHARRSTITKQSDYTLHHRHSINFHCPPTFFHLCQKAEKLADAAEIKQGLATSDNERFLRHWTEVPREEVGKRWVPYVKGSGGERWFAPIETVVDWGEDGSAIKAAVVKAYPYLKGKTAWVVKNEQYYLREGLTFSFVNSKEFAVRRLPAGCIFDVAGSAVFARDKERELFLLAYLNSSFINVAANWLNPTINFQVGDLKLLPVLSFSKDEELALAALGNSCLREKRTITSYIKSGLDCSEGLAESMNASSLYALLRDVSIDLLRSEQEIDQLVFEAVRRSLKTKEQARSILEVCEAKAAARKRTSSPFDSVEAASRWLEDKQNEQKLTLNV